MQKISIILDIEGTLVDSVPLTLACWEETLKDAGYPQSRDVLQGLSGMDGADMLKTLLPDASSRERSTILKAQGERFERKYLRHVEAFPHVRDTLQGIAGQGASLALATDCKGAVLDHYRDILGIDRFISAVACGEDVEEGKPSPDIITLALKKLGGAPEYAMMVGDTPSDAKAALREGMSCIGVLTGGFSAEALRDAGCIAVAFDIAALPRFTFRAEGGNRLGTTVWWFG